MQVYESGEDYLEMILILQNEGREVRSVDIAEAMNVSKASVSVAMKNLREGGYVTMGEHRVIFLTSVGRRLAETMYERHLLFSDVLSALGVDQDTALNDACRIEHAISAESFRALKAYFQEKGVAAEQEDNAD
ncbi:metal-dependent transcriptional regulator [Ruminococcus sp. OA3]|uniref:metal-dependent transcriptional regulator n=1 Tax=Ruminococcus sp. OA3 TaxID=2914164 RepID=UPI001F06A96C|nr:metal-dependent transcriptional regulator [Ruminococcus sp. OA3]MCH1983140.1 metal-dependent transcriptional regulator [Ruminococcus sp. OA3]